jgi:hypothetical protein
MVPGSLEFEPSGKDGVMSIPIKFECLEEDMNIKIKFDIDGKFIETPMIQLSQSGDFDSWTPAFLKPPTLTPGTQLSLTTDLGAAFEWHV